MTERLYYKDPYLLGFDARVTRASAVPEGWAVDKDGRPALVARRYLEGGAMLPFAGHKGYSLMLLIELLGGALTGAGVTQRPQVVPTGCVGFGGNSTFLIVLNPSHFTDPPAKVYYRKKPWTLQKIFLCRRVPTSRPLYQTRPGAVRHVKSRTPER